MTIDTARCRIRVFTKADIDSFMRYRNNERWMRYQGYKGYAREVYEHDLLSSPTMDAGMQLAIAARLTDALLGDVYLRRDGADCWLGYTLAPEYTGQGYASEAVSGILDWLTTNGYRRALAEVDPENTASVRLLERLGFSCCATLAAGERTYQRMLPPNGSL